MLVSSQITDLLTLTGGDEMGFDLITLIPIQDFSGKIFLLLKYQGEEMTLDSIAGANIVLQLLDTGNKERALILEQFEKLNVTKDITLNDAIKIAIHLYSFYGELDEASHEEIRKDFCKLLGVAENTQKTFIGCEMDFGGEYIAYSKRMLEMCIENIKELYPEEISEDDMKLLATQSEYLPQALNQRDIEEILGICLELLNQKEENIIEIQ